MDKSGVIRQLKALVKKHGTQAKAAKTLGVKPQYFNAVLVGRADPGPTILAALGLKKGYERA